MKTRLLIFSFLGIVFSFLVLRQADSKLQNGKTEFGIISFELAKSAVNSNAIINYWKKNNTLNVAAFSLGFDYLFMLFYALFLALWVKLVKDKLHNKFLSTLASIAIVFFITAALSDAVENYFLLKIIFDSAASEINALIAFYAASLKFVLLGVGLIYTLVVWITRKFVVF
ncbi:MAG: hypothetical protein JXR65_02690 [Bacteroidales bacterium]|nr:hypothetical protein [Bacteroidales bacterium]